MVYGDLQFFDIIIFAVIAVFLIYRLRNVLGKTYEVENIQSIIGEIQILKNELKEKNKISECASIKKEIKENFFTEL